MKVTAVAPDTIELDDAGRAAAAQPLPVPGRRRNQGWRNDGPAELRRQRRARSTSPPLALDLHYLLTAYGSADFQAEILLGYAMHLLHERPVLDRAAIRTRARPEPARRVDPAAGVPGADRRRPRRPARGGHDHAGADGHRGDVAAVVGDPGALPADGRLRRLRRADRGATTGRRLALPVLSRGRSTRSPAGSAAWRCRAAAAAAVPDDRAGRGRPTRNASRPCVLGEVAQLAGHHLAGTVDHGRVRAPPARRAEREYASAATPTETGDQGATRCHRTRRQTPSAGRRACTPSPPR